MLAASPVGCRDSDQCGHNAALAVLDCQELYLTVASFPYGYMTISAWPDPGELCVQYYPSVLLSQGMLQLFEDVILSM